MTTNPFFADATANAMCNAATALANSGFIKIYSGTQPVSSDTGLSGNTLLSTLGLSATAFGTAAPSGTAPTRSSIATANSITADTNAAATGTATWFRCYASNGTSPVFDGDVGTSAADLIINTTSIVAGATVSCSSATFAVPQ